jgi:hypothetical protein
LLADCPTYFGPLTMFISISKESGKSVSKKRPFLGNLNMYQKR